MVVFGIGSRKRVVYTFERTHEPRLEVDAPAEILIETHDARGGNLRDHET
jgi:hypothetical protein